ncbi:hypothetical protein [Romboutsia sp.]|uniref:hypothetical protein n=1 Tax=Romboutsia sp. TaxID=1965302 RepID=UPI002C8D6379|nr:hypothetical protein [Romboutsia sp.]HSQ87386.1 hypothetical protein [Romboutsia sp.]
MKFKKLLLALNIFLILIFTGCTDTNTDSQTYNSDIVIKGLSLKISLIQTAYEIYNTNIGNPSYFNESLYKETSKEAHSHYKWLKNTYSNMDDEMRNCLENIFTSKDTWEYTNAVINLNDDASIDEILNTLNSDKYLNLSNFLKKDVDKFFTYFYDEHFKSYLKKNEDKYTEKAIDLNQKLSDNDVDVMNFVETSSGIKLKQDYKSVMYYNLNPFESQSFEYNNIMVSTINSNTTAIDIVSIPFYKYSRHLFDTFTNSDEFLDICNQLKSDKKLMSMYNDFAKDSYTFNDWCAENLISGFSKFLDYKYYGSTYENASYVYDLDFYNYLKKTGFNPSKISLKDISIDFYKNIINL